MESVQDDKKEDQYSSDNREEGCHDQEEEEEEEDEVRDNIIISNLSFSAASSSYSVYNNDNISDQQQHKMTNKNNDNNNLQFMDYLSLKSSSSTNCSQSEEAGISNENLSTSTNRGGVWVCGGGGLAVEREHMFDKVVTPSDVGKLNRLVIPKQHAEKYFPLDSAENEKGLLLNFEDRNGKSWRFRYSYWNSSQSYVMTKGWSRFVKEKKLDAGDIVSFERGIGDSGTGRLYIDWRRRPHHHYHHHHHHHAMPNHTSLFPIDHHHQLQHPPPFPQPVRWGGGIGSGGLIYPLPSSVSVPMPPRHHENLQYKYDIQYPYHHHHHPRHHQQHQISGTHGYNMNNYQVGIPGNLVSPLVIESMPASAAAVAALAGPHEYHGTNTPVTPSKRLRLFGVNMEYSPKEEDQEESAAATNMASLLIPSSSSSIPYAHHDQVRLPINNNPSHPLPITNINPAEFSHKGKSSHSLSFDLDS